jgi:hypothetical protein
MFNSFDFGVESINRCIQSNRLSQYPFPPVIISLNLVVIYNHMGLLDKLFGRGEKLRLQISHPQIN